MKLDTKFIVGVYSIRPFRHFLQYAIRPYDKFSLRLSNLISPSNQAQISQRISANSCGLLKNGEWLVSILKTFSQGVSVYIFC
jgi:hypothetical protein